MNNITITPIPISSEILKGDWHSTVYAIDTISSCIEEHLQAVEESVEKIINDFNNTSHYTVSLREVERELVFKDERTKQYCTLLYIKLFK